MPILKYRDVILVIKTENNKNVVLMLSFSTNTRMHAKANASVK